MLSPYYDSLYSVTVKNNVSQKSIFIIKIEFNYNKK